ncbi:MAG: hypothetical protein ABI898_03635 [Sphingomonadales bacterium]
MTRWWENRWAIAAIIIATTIPLWFVTVPPLIDLVGHMGRYHIQISLDDVPALQANWDYHWRLIGNLGGDLLMEGLGRIFGVERGSVIFAGLILAVMMSGMVRLARAAHGTVPATAWAAFPFAMSYPWQYGLVNYWLGVGLALHATAWGWKVERRRWAYFALVSLPLWVAHIYGWAVFAVLMGAHAVAGRPWKDWLRQMPLLLPLTLPAFVMHALNYGQKGAETQGWLDFGYKAYALIWTLRDQHQWFDMGCLVAATVLIYAGFRSKSFIVDKGLSLGALGLFVSLLIIPYQLVGSAYADARLWPVIFIVALLAIRPADRDGKLSARLATAAAAIFAIRIAATTIGFQGYAADYDRHFQALNLMARGSRVAVFTEFPCDVPWRRPRLDHLDGIAIVRRDVFTNGQWDVPGAQMLVPLGAKGTRYNADPSQFIMGCGDLRPGLAKRIAKFPRDRFQFVWLIGYRPETLPRYGGLTPIFADDRTILYRIDR